MEELHAKYRGISESNITRSDPKEASALGLCRKESHGGCIGEYQRTRLTKAEAETDWATGGHSRDLTFLISLHKCRNSQGNL